MAAPYVCIRRTNVCDDDHASFADVTLVSDEVIKNLNNVGQVFKGSQSLEERKCPRSIFPVES